MDRQNLAALAATLLTSLLCASLPTANAFQENAANEQGGSHYQEKNGPTGAIVEDGTTPTTPQEMYNYYYYYDGPSGQTIVAIIFIDIFLPIACCIGIIVTIVCVVKHINKKRRHEMMEAHESRRQEMIANGQNPDLAYNQMQQPNIAYVQPGQQMVYQQPQMMMQGPDGQLVPAPQQQ